MTPLPSARCLLALLAAAAALAVPAAHAQFEPDDVEGPPAYTANGCAADREWTDAYLAQHFGTSDRTVRRARSKYNARAVNLCTMGFNHARDILARADGRKKGFDEPDGAMAFRQISLLSDDGKIADGGLAKAFVQRQAVVEETKAKLGGLTPGQPFWTAIGPSNVGGRVRAILPLSPTRVLVGSVGGGLWLSENANAASASIAWTPVRDLMPSVAITCLVPDPADASIIYVCTGEGFFNIDAVRGDGIWRITGANGAPATWTITQVPGTSSAAGAQWRYVNRLIVLPNGADPNNVNNRLLVAATGGPTTGGIYRSTNGGTSFSLVRSGRHLDMKYHPLDWANLVAGNDAGGVAYSSDGGATWNPVATTGLPVSGGGRVEVMPVAGQPQTWLASVDVTAGQLWRSTNGGATWTRRDTAGLDNVTGAGGVLGTQGWYDNALWASPDGTRVIVGGVGIRLSVDGGLTFGLNGAQPGVSTYGAGIPGIHVDHHAVVPGTDFATTGTVFFGNDGGVYRASGLHTVASNNPGSIMTNLNNTLAITQFYGGAAAGSGGTFKLTGGTQDNGSWTYNGSTWSNFNGGDGGEGAVDPTNTQYVYGEFQYGIVYRSMIGGVSANPYPEEICVGILDVDCGNAAAVRNVNFIPPFILDPNQPDRMLMGAASLWRSNNVRSSTGGVDPAAQPTWTAIRASNGSRVSAIAVAPGNSDIVWVGYNNGQVAYTTNATAASPTWNVVAFTGVTAPARAVLRILIDPSNSQRVWVGLGGYNTNNVLRTVNGGANWTDVHGNLPQVPVRALVRHPSSPDVLYAGTDVGVFATETAGTTWSATNEGPGTVSVEELFFSDAATLYAATHGRGFFRATINLATAPGSLQFASSTASATEGGAIQLQVTRIGGTFGAASVNYATGSGTATSGSDFTATAGTFNWADGDATARTITIPTAVDAIAEASEAFTVTLSGATGATLGSPATATATIFDPEAFPPNGVLPPGAWSTPTTTPAGATDASIAKGWIVDTNAANAYQGSLSLRSDTITHNQKAVTELRIYTAAGNFSFARRVSSEAGWDCLRFYVDGTVQGVSGTCTNTGGTGASGELAWAVVTVPVTAGMHTFRWSYEKDGSVSSGSDAAWIDAITLPATALDPAQDTDGDGVPNGVELNEAINPTVKDNDVFAATPKGARLFAMQQYRDFLSREGDEAGISGWTGLVTAGTYTRPQVIDAFFNSAEFGGVVAPVVRLYFATFLRVPDYAGLTYNVGLIRAGTVTLQALADFFAGSPEFQTRYGALTNTQFVTLLYNNVLGRAPDAAGLNGWVALLNGGMSRGQVLLGFSESPEYKAAMANEVMVTMMYAGMLRRTPETAGYNGWLAYLDGGNSALNMINGFYLSTEYRARFLP